MGENTTSTSFATWKQLSLCVLVVHTTALVLTMRYSRVVQGPDYLSSTAVTVSELMKIGISLAIVIYKKSSSQPTLQHQLMGRMEDCIKLSLPAGLYTLQNNLQYLAVSSLDAATYQVTYQLKILTTALFSVFLLHKRLNMTKWLSLLILTCGVALVQMPTSSSDRSVVSSSAVAGLTAVFCSCFSSGFAGVYFEKVLKGSPQSLWIRNIQLGVFGVIFGLVSVYTMDYRLVMKHGFFYGYTILTWIVISLQATLGLVVSLVIKYADNILKGFATSLSIVLSTVISCALLGDLKPTVYFVIGSTAVISATFLYSSERKKPSFIIRDSMV